MIKILIGLSLLATAINAMTAYNHPLENGVVVRGTPCNHYETDIQGFLVVPNQAGEYVYVERIDKNGRMLSHHEPIRIGHAMSDVGLLNVKDLTQSQSIINCLTTVDEPVSTVEFKKQAGLQDIINRKNLVLLIRFADHINRILPDPESYRVLLNSNTTDQVLNPTGSLKTYYNDQSLGLLTIDSDVIGWIDVPYNETEVTMGCSALCRDSTNQATLHHAIIYALQNISHSINFENYDLNHDGIFDVLTVIHSGYGAEFGGYDKYGTHMNYRVWSHKWSLTVNTIINGMKFSLYNINPGLWGTSSNSITRLGVLVHEYGHVLGLPDLYDSLSPYSAGIGTYDVMCDSWGVRVDQYYPGSFSPWSKIKLGWVHEVELTQSGEYQVDQWHKSNFVFKITQGYNQDEYLLIESRSTESIWDSTNPSGVYIWHIDNSMGSNWNRFESYPGHNNWPFLHFRIRLIQADNRWDLEKQAWYRYDQGDAFTNQSFVLNDSSEPNIRSYYNQNGQTNNAIYDIKFNNNGISTFKYKNNPMVTLHPSLSPTVAPTFELVTDPPIKFCNNLEKRRCRRHKSCSWIDGECYNKRSPTSN